MITQRVGVAALRRGTAMPSVFFNQHVPKLALASNISTTQSRLVATAKVSNQEGHDILARQRLNRPVAPHLGIYKMEQTWFSLSAWTRITGCTLSGAAYVYFSSYLVAPLLGMHLETASLVAAFGAMPLIAKGAVKFALAFPFAYHFIMGTMHLVYDTGAGFTKASIMRAHTFIWAGSVVAALGLVIGL